MKTNSQYPVLVTDQIKETLDFYTNTLGYSIKHEAVTKNNTKVYVLSNENGNELDLVEKTSQLHTGLYGLRMNVKDIHQALEEINQQGCKVILGPVRTNNGINLVFEDLNGVVITLIQHM